MSTAPGPVEAAVLAIYAHRDIPVPAYWPEPDDEGYLLVTDAPPARR